jgi:two-component system heavy metal sensor histidine kinase CusS
MNATTTTTLPEVAAAPEAATFGAPAQQAACGVSIGARLSKRLAFFTMAVLGALSATCWFSVAMMFKQQATQEMESRVVLMSDLLRAEARRGGEAAVLKWAAGSAAMRPQHTRLELWRADGTALWADPLPANDEPSEHMHVRRFGVEATTLPGGRVEAALTADFTHRAATGDRWAVILVLTTLLAGGVVAGRAFYMVRRELEPLRLLAAQTRAISPQQLDRRLHLDDPAEELLPFIEQFNALMQRLERAYAQLEAFNADVAHELRTPLATLIGQTEVALARERSNDTLRDTLASNLEEMQRLAALVNDMLFLSRADSGAMARRGQPVNLASLAHEVAEFHEAALEDAGVALAVEGEAALACDEALVRRALSNLIGNATRFAERGSTIVVRIAPPPAALPAAPAAGGEVVAGEAGEPGTVGLVVVNRGPTIEAQHLPRLFDRFFRGEASRCCVEGEAGHQQHYGLGLAIVAAIARMHAGRPLVHSEGGVTRVGFTIATA